MKLIQPLDPLKYKVSQWFGVCHASTCKFYADLGLKSHNGIDFACPIGTPLLASHDGKVSISTSSGGCKMLYIKGGGYMTAYFHLSTYNVGNGENVKAGDVVAYSGNTGKYTTGPHLHFGLYELTKSGNIKNYNNGYHGAIDPSPYLAKKYDNGTLVKTISEPKVYLIHNGVKWWLKDPITFEKWMGYKVKGPITEMDLITYKNYPYGEIRFVV